MAISGIPSGSSPINPSPLGTGSSGSPSAQKDKLAQLFGSNPPTLNAGPATDTFEPGGEATE